MKKELNVVILGGSITEGAGATDYNNCYAKIVSNYIKESLYPDMVVNTNNAGSSGTGSRFGLFRLERDVISKNPDIVFIEFAANDRIVDSREAAISMEGIVRNLCKLKSCPYIIFLITPTEMSDACGDVHKKTAYRYNIPVIDVQNYVWKEIGKGSFTGKDIDKDSFYPNDKGHKVYCDYIISCISKNQDEYNIKPKLVNSPIMDYTYNDPRLVNYEKGTFYVH